MKHPEHKVAGEVRSIDFYQESAARFHTPDPVRLAAYGLGIAGEAGECADLIKKHIGHGHPLDVEKLKLELGDVLWYVAGLATVCGLTLGDIATTNLAKLEKRYPNGFNTADSIARRDVSHTSNEDSSAGLRRAAVGGGHPELPSPYDLSSGPAGFRR